MEKLKCYLMTTQTLLIFFCKERPGQLVQQKILTIWILRQRARKSRIPNTLHQKKDSQRFKSLKVQSNPDMSSPSKSNLVLQYCNRQLDWTEKQIKQNCPINKRKYDSIEQDLIFIQLQLFLKSLQVFTNLEDKKGTLVRQLL